MKVFITGGAGMVGSHAAEYYAKDGHEVVVLDNLWRSKLFNYDRKSVEYNWEYFNLYPNITRILGDVRNWRDIRRGIKNADLVIHTAGQPGVPLSMREPMEDFAINALGTVTTLELTRQYARKATFCYCSTNKIYGENVDLIELEQTDMRYIWHRKYDDVPTFKGIKEDFNTAQTGRTPYGASKYTGDIYTQEYARIYGMKTGVFRMSCTYATRQFGFEDQGWVAWFIIAALFNREVTVFGDGKQVRDLLYADDLVKAFDMFHKSDLKHEVFNIGGGMKHTISLLELAHVIKEKTGKVLKYKIADWRPSDQKCYISDITKLKEKLNWEPTVNVSDGIDKLIAWIKEHEDYFA